MIGRIGYLLLGLDGRAALRFSPPAIGWFAPLRAEEAHPLCAAHVVPVERGRFVIQAFALLSVLHPNKMNRQIKQNTVSCLFAQTTEQNLLEPLKV